MTLSDQELINLNARGFIPGPREGEEAFLQRVKYCENLKGEFASQLGQQLPLELASMPLELEKEVNGKTKALFDIVLDWVPVVFSNYKMALWHGGCAWIFQMSQDSPTAAFFQLRKSLAKKQTYLGLYDREELVEHESAHVGRMMFQEPKFEEVIAYRTSKSAFRKFFGPIVQAPWESLLFLLILFFCLIGELYFLSSNASGWGGLLMWLKGAAVLLIILGLGRVVLRQWQFSRCHKVLESALGNGQKADAVIYRLQDHEIISFGKMTQEAIRKYAQEQDSKSLRWKVINRAYLE